MTEGWKSSALYNEGPDSLDAIEQLQKVSPIKLPEAYIEFLEFSRGGEWHFKKQPCCFVSNSSQVITSEIVQKEYDEFFPGFIMIGSNGAGEHIAFDIRGVEPWPVVALDMTNIDLEKSVLPIAPDFVTFLRYIAIPPNDED